MHAPLKRGFTTLETIVVVVMFGTTAAITGPKLYANFAATTSRTTADRLARAAELAHVAAVRYRRPAELHLDAAAKKFWVQVDTTVNLTGVKDTIGIVEDMSSTKVGMSLTLNGRSVSRAVLCLDAHGNRTTKSPCQSGAAVAVFRLDRHVDSLQVTSMGRVIR